MRENHDMELTGTASNHSIKSSKSLCICPDGQDFGEPMSLDPAELVQNKEVSKTLDNIPNGA
jgi:hypothetical protein